MKRFSKIRLVIVTLGVAGAFLIPSNGKADFFPWGGGCCGSTYGVGYFPSYWGGYYGGPYSVGYYPMSFAGGYYGSGCCGGLGSSCGTLGCGTCGLGCGGYGVGCGSCGIGCGSCGVGCGSSCCGTGCGTGLACSGGSGSVPAADCSGAPPAAGPKKPIPNSDERFEARPSPNYDEPPARRPRKAPTTTPEPGPGAIGPPGATGTDNPPNGEPASTPGFRRSPAADDPLSSVPKPPTSDSSGPKSTTPAPAKPSDGAAPGDLFNAKKPTGPSPPQQSGKKAPITNVPDADSSDAGQDRSMASSPAVRPSELAHNPALGLQDQPTWGFAGIRQSISVRIASSRGPIPQRLKSQKLEWTAEPVETKVARN